MMINKAVHLAFLQLYIVSGAPQTTSVINLATVPDEYKTVHQRWQPIFNINTGATLARGIISDNKIQSISNSSSLNNCALQIYWLFL